MAWTDRVFVSRMPRLKRPKITKALVDAAMAGNRSAMHALVGLLMPAIRWKIARVLLLAGRTCEQDIKDVIAMTLEALIVVDDGKLIRRWDPMGRSCESYARFLAQRQAGRFLYKHRREIADGFDTSGPRDHEGSPEEKVAECELGHKALEVLRAELSPLGRRYMQLLIMEERTTEEVCAIMNISEEQRNKVDKQRSRLRKRLDRLMMQLGGDA